MFGLFLAATLLQSSPPAQKTPERPRDVWAIRSVLDKNARMVTLALNKDLWAAYDATNCGIFKVWNGDVKFDGSVYTTAHGPQPTSIGAAYIRGFAESPAWTVDFKGQRRSVKPAFRGYSIRKNVVTLAYEFTFESGKVMVAETPDFFRDSAGRPGYQRMFKVGKLPAGVTLGCGIGQVQTLAHADITSNGKLDLATARSMPGFTTGTCWLKSGETWLKTVFTAEPSRAEEDLSASIEEEAAQSQEGNPGRVPGISYRLYSFKKSVDKIPALVAGQSPNVNKVVPNINIKGEQAFDGFTDGFLVHFTGFLNVTQLGDYKFRLSSDDGSRFHIRDEVIIDHDGPHGEVPMTGQFRLAPGEHPIFVEYYEGGGDQVVRLEWMKPGSTVWEVIPESAFTTPAGEVRVTAPGEKNIIDPLNLRAYGDGRPLGGVHPAYDLITVRPKDFKPRVGGIDFLPDGRMVICNWEPDGGVYIIDGVLGAAKTPKVKRIAKGLAEPLGIKVVNGKIYVLQKQELTRLDDLDGDEIIDRYFCVANGWGVTDNFHEFAFGLVYKDGFFYGNLATAINPGGASTSPQNPERGKTIKIGLDGKFEFVASGLRTPNGIGLGVDNEIFVTDNQGDWLPVSKLIHIQPGDFFGNRSVEPIKHKDTKEKPPVVWLPQGEIGNSPSTPLLMKDGPYKGQMIHGDVTHGGVKRVFIEKINGAYQGVVFRFTQGLEGGVNRIAWGPDGALYVGGIGSSGNWGQEGKERFGLEKIKFNGKIPFEMLSVKAKTNGMEVQLTQPMAEGVGLEPADYEVRQWRYVPTKEYGGPKVDPERLVVKSVTVSQDRRTIFLELPGMKAGRVVYVRLDPMLPSATGSKLWSTEAWYTLNAIPAGRVVKPMPVNEAAMGWKNLFSADMGASWTSYRGQTFPSAWQMKDGVLSLPAKARAGDIATKETYANFDLVVDWNVEPGGNSGIFYLVNDAFPAAYSSGPEYQLLDNVLGADGKSPLTSAGANYALQPTRTDVCRPAGQWNRARIWHKDGRVKHFLNGFLVADYTLGSPEWTALVKKSKFASMPNFGKFRTGKIVLQDHGNQVSFRNMKIRRL